MASRILGLDVGRLSIKAVVLEGTARAWELVDVIEEPIESQADGPPEDEASDASGAGEQGLAAPTLSALRALADRGAFAVDGVVAAIRAEDAVVTRLALPFAGAREIQAVLVPQLEGRLPAEVDDLLIDFERGAQLPSQEYVVYTAAVRPELVAERLGDLASVGVDPRALAVAPFHLRSLVTELSLTSGGPIAIVDLGAESAGVVVTLGGELQYARSFPWGGERVTESLARAFSLDVTVAREGKHREGFIDAAAPELNGANGDDRDSVNAACLEATKPLVKQLRRTLQAHAAEWGHGVERVFLVGGGALLPGLPEYLGQSLGVEVQLLPVQSAAFARLPEFAPIAPRFATALALGIRGMAPARAATMNARLGPFTFRGSYDFLRAVVPQLAGGAAALAALCGLVVLSRIALLRAEERALDRALSAVTTALFDEELTDPNAIRRELTMRSARPAFLPKESAYDLLVTLSETVAETLDLGYDVSTTEAEIDLERRIFRVEGRADSAESVDTFQRTLGAKPCFLELERSDLSQSSDGEGFDFTFQGVASCTPIAEDER